MFIYISIRNLLSFFVVNVTLQALVEFFQRVIDHQAKNKMTLNNVSVVMAPNIFMFKGFRLKVTEQQEFSMATNTANIVRLLIRYQHILWNVRLRKLQTLTVNATT